MGFMAQGELMLASGSSARRMLLENAGLKIVVRPVSVDEEALRRDCTERRLDAGKTAVALADAKGRAACALAENGTLVLAADQILECEGAIFSKPAAISDARAQLQALRGRVHILHTAIVLWRAESGGAAEARGTRLWEHLATPRLTMRDFSDGFLDAYLAAEGKEILSCVGAYRLEGAGVHLFSQITGAQDAILGLPLLPLLTELRRMGVLLT